VKRVSVDVGGTFTDCLVLDEHGAVREYKASTTPSDPAQGLLDALAKAADDVGTGLDEFLGEVEILIHGTTLAINALLTGLGAPTGMITTENFRDVIEMRRGLRDLDVSMFNIFVPPYKPLVPRRWRIGVPERIRHTGDVLVPLDENAVRAAAEKLKAEGVESVAVCFLYSFLRPEHERRAAQICEEVFGGGRVTASHEILPIWREFERFSTTAVSAYVAPLVADYLDSLVARLEGEGFRGSLVMMLANGLVQTAEQVRRRAVYLLASGPAAAPAAAIYLAEPAAGNQLISIDMGGTSFEVCAIRDGEVPTTTESWVGKHRVAIKMVDTRSIGSGGGSIASIDSLGLLKVGPESAGADPGPACYGKGNTQPTVTDANVVLGYVPADYFLGGDISLDAEKAREAVAGLAEKLGMTVEGAAQAIVETVNAQMADLITEVCTRRGLDVHDFALVAGGGAGPAHAAFLADRLDIEKVVVPSVAALYSAFGMLTMDLGRDFARSYVVRVESVEPEAVDRLYSEMEEEAVREFEPLGLAREDLTFARTAEMRYVGQFHEVEIEFPGGPVTAKTIETALALLHAKHEDLFTFSMPWVPAQFLTFRLVATAARTTFELRGGPEAEVDASTAIRRSRVCYWQGAAVDTPVYDGTLVRPGHVLHGPAIVEERTTTIVVPEGFVCGMDERRNYVLQKAAADDAERTPLLIATGIEAS
jgi:N-methylhydantoinase A